MALPSVGVPKTRHKWLAVVRSVGARESDAAVVRSFAGSVPGLAASVWPHASRASKREALAVEDEIVAALRERHFSQLDGRVGVAPHQRACRVVSTSPERAAAIGRAVFAGSAATRMALVPEFTIFDVPERSRAGGERAAGPVAVVADLDRGLLIVKDAPGTAMVAQAVADLLEMLYLLDGVLPVRGTFDASLGQPATLTIGRDGQRFAWGAAGLAALDEPSSAVEWAPHPARVVLCSPAGAAPPARRTVNTNEAMVHFAMTMEGPALGAAAIGRVGLFRRRLAETSAIVEVRTNSPSWRRPTLRVLPGGANRYA